MWIQNVSFDDIKKGNHRVSDSMMLIQIVDIDRNYPRALMDFDITVGYKFLDLEEKDVFTCDWDPKISVDQAKGILFNLLLAKERKMDVVVHCHMGVCRSGAVAEVGVMLGFEDAENWRQPNLLVKKRLMDILGWGY
ncbi:MAG: hypothetical protein GY810_01075 [Aureispira sp.]|nr:hypothetical protein [Aureispira sp.]